MKIAFATERNLTAAQAIEEAGIGFEVRKEPVYMESNGLYLPIEDTFVNVRQDTLKGVGVVGKKYEILQTNALVDFIDIFREESGGLIDTAGEFGGGRQVFISVNIPMSWKVLLGDQVDGFGLISNSFDGTLRAEVRFGCHRTVCRNTFLANLKKHTSTISLSHTSGVHERMEIAKKVLVDMKAYFTTLGETFDQFANFKIDDDYCDTYTKLLFGEMPPLKDGNGIAQAIWTRKVTTFEGMVEKGRGTEIPGVRGSLWGLFNAATEYSTHEYPIRKGTDRDESVLFGAAADFGRKAFDSALALVKRR